MILNYFSNLSYLAIECNSDCNLSCQSCNRKDLVGKGWRKKVHLDLEVWGKMLDRFVGCPLKVIKVEGISEPMLHPHFDLMVREVRRKFPSAYVIIATNLQYDFDRSSFRKALEFVDMVYLSIDAIGDRYESLRPPGKWGAVIDWLEAAKNQIPDSIRAEKLFINMVLREENLKDLEAIVELQNKYGLAPVRINLMQNWSGENKEKTNFSDLFLESLIPYRHLIKGVADWKYSDCFWPYEGIVVDVFGDVRPCLLNTSVAPVGNIFQDDISMLYNKGSFFQKMRENLSHNVAPENCINCDYCYLAPKLKAVFGDSFLGDQARGFKK